MPPVSEYVLKGGPCDGKTGQLTGAIADSGQVICSNHVYKVVLPVQIDSGREVFQDAGQVPKPKPAVPAPKFHSGWHHLSRTMHTQWSQSVSEARRNTREALRTVGHGRKVGR